MIGNTLKSLENSGSAKTHASDFQLTVPYGEDPPNHGAGKAAPRFQARNTPWRHG